MLKQLTYSNVNTLFFTILRCDVLSMVHYKRALWCVYVTYKAKIVRGNKEGGITKVFSTVIQEYGE